MDVGCQEWDKLGASQTFLTCDSKAWTESPWSFQSHVSNINSTLRLLSTFSRIV